MSIFVLSKILCCNDTSTMRLSIFIIFYVFLQLWIC